jgi:hypothetical protein
MEITNKLKKRFVKDFSLPIQIYSEPYFSYFIKTYNKVYKTVEKYDYFIHLVKKLGGEKRFFDWYDKKRDEIINSIKENDAYKKFIAMDLKKYYPINGKSWNKKNNIYRPENNGKIFVSIDLIKANFHSLRFVDPKIVLGNDYYRDLINNFTYEPYIHNSKYIRQVIFGNLNPNRQQHVQKYIIESIIDLIKENFEKNNKTFFSPSCTTSDEIIVSLPDLIFGKAFYNYMFQISDFACFKKFRFFNLSIFKLVQIENTDCYVKEFIDSEKVEFKKCSKVFFAQHYKKYFKQPIEDYDLHFYYECQICKFKSPLFVETMNNELFLNNEGS